MARASRRSAAAHASPSSPARPTRTRKPVKEEPVESPIGDDDMDVDANGEDDGVAEADEDAEQHQPGPSRRARAKPRKSGATPKRRGRPKIEEDATDEDDDDEDHQNRRRSGKQVSYKEIPIDVDEAEEEEEDDIEEDDDKEETPAPTPSRRGKGRTVKDKDGDKPYKREPGTGGRGGFSVKGAAAAAARARWDKVRRERAERGEDSDDGERKRRSAPAPKKDPRGALENVVAGQKYTIKGKEYIAGEDELILPENEKGEAKIDAEGRLQGGREYKLTTFTSASRRNPNRLYALTIDAARACGYTDSLAFLRRCPQIVKLSCDLEERQMLIEVGRITGNLKHRAVTMVAIRNVYKLMGARLVKNGKWVDDDYNEEQGLLDCATNGWTPHGPVLEEELAVNQYPSAGGPGRPAANAGMLADAGGSKAFVSQSFYTAGGPTTHFGGNGADPWSDHLHGRRGRLRQLGVTEEDWILRTAEESRRIDEALRSYREERIGQLEGPDAAGWVYTAEQRSANELPDAASIRFSSVKPHHPLATEVTFDNSSEPLSPAPPDSATEAVAPPTSIVDDRKPAEVQRVPGGKIVVESAKETEYGAPRAGQWTPGVVRAAYEPHTQMPHVPLRTQPSVASYDRMSYNPLIGVDGEARLTPLPGFASVEFVFNPTHPEAEDPYWLSFGDGTRGAELARIRRSQVKEAEEWERAARAKRA